MKNKENIKMKKGSKEELLKFYGVLKNEDIDWNAKENRMRELRNSFNKRLGKAMNIHSEN